MKTPLTLTFKDITTSHIDMSAITPDKLASMTLDKIKAIKLPVMNRPRKLMDFFTITGNDTNNIHIKNANVSMHNIGKKMSSGSLSVYGNVGDYVGCMMSGGLLRVHGSVIDYAGSMMSGGTLHINKNAGDYIAAALPGYTQGMSNGHIYIGGNAGDRLGDKMRRGLILVKKSCGNYCGSRMLAGTIIILQQTGEYLGSGMSRGTILLLQKPTIMLPTMQNCGDLEMPFLSLLNKQLYKIGKPFQILKIPSTEVTRFAGDLANDGKGEILICKS